MIQFDEHIFQLGWFNHQLDERWRDSSLVGCFSSSSHAAVIKVPNFGEIKQVNWVEEQSPSHGDLRNPKHQFTISWFMFHSEQETLRLKDGRILPPSSMYISQNKKKKVPHCSLIVCNLDISDDIFATHFFTSLHDGKADNGETWYFELWSQVHQLSHFGWFFFKVEKKLTRWSSTKLA